MSFAVGQTIDDTFRIDEVLFTGALTTVFVAFDVDLGRRVIVKALNREVLADNIHQERFRREAESAARLTHQHIVKIMRRGEFDGVPYIVTEFIDGQTLAQLMGSQPARQTLPTLVTISILEQTASALDYAHENDLVHRDVKPSNIMVDLPPNGPPTVHLIDFGITKRIVPNSPATQIGFVGTADYASPEQIRADSDLDGRSDVYSFACTAFEMLTAHQPYSEAVDGASRIAMHLTADTPKVSTTIPEFGIAVDAVFAKGLAKNKLHRYSTCTEFVEALRLATGNQPPPIAPSDSDDVLPPSSWRRGALLAAAGVLAIVVLAGLWRSFSSSDNSPTDSAPVTAPPLTAPPVTTPPTTTPPTTTPPTTTPPTTTPPTTTPPTTTPPTTTPPTTTPPTTTPPTTAAPVTTAPPVTTAAPPTTPPPPQPPAPPVGAVRENKPAVGLSLPVSDGADVYSDIRSNPDHSSLVLCPDGSMAFFPQFAQLESAEQGNGYGQVDGSGVGQLQVAFGTFEPNQTRTPLAVVVNGLEANVRGPLLNLDLLYDYTHLGAEAQRLCRIAAQYAQIG